LTGSIEEVLIIPGPVPSFSNAFFPEVFAGAVRFGFCTALFTEVMKAGEVLAQEIRFWRPFGHDPWEQREELRDLNPLGNSLPSLGFQLRCTC
jgi:hypothetical protein